MQVFITSTPEELAPYRAAAADVVRDLGLEPVLGDDRGRRSVGVRVEQVTAADLAVALVGHRRGEVPAPEIGGDGFHPWAWWETHAAFERHRPVKVLMAADSWRPELRESKPRAAAVMRDFRGELRRLAAFFGEEGEDDAEAFRRLVRRQLEEARSATPTSLRLGGLRLRRWPPPPLPDHPYPVLLPYSHPDLMSGRERELADLRRLLAEPVPILGLHAPSGAGKSSFLSGGLVATLRAERRPVAFDRYPDEAGLAERLLGDLVDGDAGCSDEDPERFVDRLLAVRRAADEPPVLVLDQFEDLLRRGAARRARAVAGTLLAASVQRQPGLHEAPCRWVLAYRQEFHGKVVQWLEDVLRDASAEGLPAASTLPHDLAEPERFRAWCLSPLGTPPPGSEDPAGDATSAFLGAITKPLAHYPLRFEPGLAERLARAFGEARARSPRAPLGPELQVMLAHVLASGSARQTGDAAGTVVVELPEDPGSLIGEALEQHLRRALDSAFPGRHHRLERTRALLALRQMADESGRRDEGLDAGILAQAIGAEGRQALEKLATAETRIVVARAGPHDDEPSYTLSHDRMAEVVVRLVDEGRFASLGVDGEVLGLRRFVALHSELHAAGEVGQATAVPHGRLRRIEENADALLWSDAQRGWFEACGERRRRDRRRRWLGGAAAALLVALVALLAWRVTSGRAERRALREEIVHGDPASAFAALDRLLAAPGANEGEVRALLGRRTEPFDVFATGAGGVAEPRRGPAVVRLAEIVLPLDDADAEDPTHIAPLVWALDSFARGPDVAERARSLRRDALRGLRRSHPPPMPPARDDPLWADIPAGTLSMGETGPSVTVPAFRMLVREVSFRDFRRLVPDWRPDWDGELPVAFANWAQAYTYAAWLGGRLPTEAEWEHAARAGCRFDYCKRDGSEASAGEVARHYGNSFDTGESTHRSAPGMRYEPNPWGLFDMYGNLHEWTADLHAPASEEEAPDEEAPEGEAADRSAAGRSASGQRIVKGGSFRWHLHGSPAGLRMALPWISSSRDIGFRVVLDQSLPETVREK